MSIIFLDVDGILNNRQAIREAADKGSCIGALDTDCLERFVNLVNSIFPRPLIVLTSSWRFSTRAYEILGERLWEYGLIISFSTDKYGGGRGEQIKRWLDARPEHKYERILILEDEPSDLLPEQLPFVVKPNMETGLTDEHVRQAAEILGLRIDP